MESVEAMLLTLLISAVNRCERQTSNSLRLLTPNMGPQELPERGWRNVLI